VSDGLLLTDRLGDRLGVWVGDTIAVEVLEGERIRREVVVDALVHELVGLSAYMELNALRRFLREGQTISAVTVSVESSRADEIYAHLKALPKVATVSIKATALQSFQETTAAFVLVFTGILTVFAVIIAIGIVYNHARITLAERAWELASLRVLGCTRGEVSLNRLGISARSVAQSGGCLPSRRADNRMERSRCDQGANERVVLEWHAMGRLYGEPWQGAPARDPDRAARRVQSRRRQRAGAWGARYRLPL
jgi:hypothetical protein